MHTPFDFKYINYRLSVTPTYPNIPLQIIPSEVEPKIFLAPISFSPISLPLNISTDQYQSQYQSEYFQMVPPPDHNEISITSSQSDSSASKGRSES